MLIIIACAINSEQNILASAGSNGVITLWDTTSSNGLLRFDRSLFGHSDTILDISFGKNNVLASGGSDESIIIFPIKYLHLCSLRLIQ